MEVPWEEVLRLSGTKGKHRSTRSLRKCDVVKYQKDISRENQMTKGYEEH